MKKNAHWIRLKLTILIHWLAKELTVENISGGEKGVKTIYTHAMFYACAHTATVPEGPGDGLAGDHEEQVNIKSEGRRGKADGRVKRKPAKSLNPVEFLSSSVAPLGGVRSLWRERGKTGPVRNKAPNSHDMFS